MLEKPLIPDAKLIACLQDEFGLEVEQITFLPLGADANTAVYRIETTGGNLYFLKLRSGAFDETSLELTAYMRERGIRQIIAPLKTKRDQLHADLSAYRVILYPYIEGQSGFKVKLSAQQWFEFGTALKEIHRLKIPPSLAQKVRREEFSARWRDMVIEFLWMTRENNFEDPVAREVAALLQEKHRVILDLIERAERLSYMLRLAALDFVLCHSDIHAGNVLIDAGGNIYLVDWDDPIMAPKERDLMYIGGAQGFISSGSQEEETLFYQGYGQVEIEYQMLAYYRYERIIEDIAAYCEELLMSTTGGEDRQQSLVYLKTNFEPGNTIENAYLTDNRQ